jgi:hypothetical protein
MPHFRALQFSHATSLNDLNSANVDGISDWTILSVFTRLGTTAPDGFNILSWQCIRVVVLWLVATIKKGDFLISFQYFFTFNTYSQRSF